MSSKYYKSRAYNCLHRPWRPSSPGPPSSRPRVPWTGPTQRHRPRSVSRAERGAPCLAWLAASEYCGFLLLSFLLCSPARSPRAPEASSVSLCLGYDKPPRGALELLGPLSPALRVFLSPSSCSGILQSYETWSSWSPSNTRYHRHR